MQSFEPLLIVCLYFFFPRSLLQFFDVLSLNRKEAFCVELILDDGFVLGKRQLGAETAEE